MKIVITILIAFILKDYLFAITSFLGSISYSFICECSSPFKKDDSQLLHYMDQITQIMTSKTDKDLMQILYDKHQQKEASQVIAATKNLIERLQMIMEKRP